jgi:outer membrane protein assembly factor BamB
VVLSAVAILAVAAGVAADTDWPQFRGPNRDGVSKETGLLTDWPEAGPRRIWQVELGKGYSGIAVASGRVYTMFAEGRDELAVALDAATGAEIWRVRVGDKFKEMFGDGPRSTPTVDGERVYVLGARGMLYALATSDGKQIWKHDLGEEFGASTPKWGFATSPLVDQQRLLVNVGGSGGSSIVAFDKGNGKELWRSQEDKAGYSTPIVITIGERRQVVFFTGNNLVAVAPEDGRLLWKQPWKTSYDVNAATPVFVPPDRIFVSSGYDVGGAVYRVAAGEVVEVWRNREMKNKFSSSVLHDGHLYGFDEKTFKCVDAANGETRWESRGLGHGSLLYADGHLIVLGDKGALSLVEATPEGYRETARYAIFKGKTWTMPTLSGGTLYVRDEKQMVALDVSK